MFGSLGFLVVWVYSGYTRDILRVYSGYTWDGSLRMVLGKKKTSFLFIKKSMMHHRNYTIKFTLALLPFKSTMPVVLFLL